MQSPAKPQSLNRYSYCSNNPLKYVDPSGHFQTDDGGSYGIAEQETPPIQEVTSFIFTVTAFVPVMSLDAADESMTSSIPLTCFWWPFVFFDIFTKTIPPKIPIASITVEGTVTTTPLGPTTDIDLRFKVKGTGISVTEATFTGVNNELPSPFIIHDYPCIDAYFGGSPSDTTQRIKLNGAGGNQGTTYGNIIISHDITGIGIKLTFEYNGREIDVWLEPKSPFTIQLN